MFNILGSFGAANLMLTSEGLVMDHPELSGHDGDRSYKVTARRAIQRLSDPRIIDLETIRADIVLGQDESAEIVALKGTYNNAQETLRLYDGIQLDWSEGYKVDLTEVSIDLNNGALSTSTPIQIRSDQGRVQAGRISYDQNKGLVRFTDGIKMTLNPASEGQ
ncbi:MAG: LPS export ABC transporter periplasmic protein LptC, partial [Roseibium sp.]